MTTLPTLKPDVVLIKLKDGRSFSIPRAQQLAFEQDLESKKYVKINGKTFKTSLIDEVTQEEEEVKGFGLTPDQHAQVERMKSTYMKNFGRYPSASHFDKWRFKVKHGYTENDTSYLDAYYRQLKDPIDKPYRCEFGTTHRYEDACLCGRRFGTSSPTKFWHALKAQYPHLCTPSDITPAMQESVITSLRSA